MQDDLPEMTAVQDIIRVVGQRSDIGRGYSNPQLEQKRQAAIVYLRTESTMGWLFDNFIRLCK